MFSFKDYVNQLNEKLIVFRGKRSKFGRIVFLAGGAGSGKEFAMKNFLDISSTTDKVRDVDAWKVGFIELDKINKKFPEIRGLDLRKPSDVGKIHKFVSEKNIKNKTLNNMLKDLRSDRLPNIVFDVTLKDRGDMEDVIPDLLKVGYKSEDIHLVWVLTNFEVAVSRNRSRPRIVPDDILLKTHEGAAKTMFSILKGSIPKGMNGEIHVILNNQKNTVFFTDKQGKPLSVTPKFGPEKGQKKLIVKDFLSMKAKEAGKPISSEKNVNAELLNWIRDNIPRSKSLADIFDDKDGKIKF